MSDRAARLFAKWRDRGSARALARAFDRTAPDLLRVALHLAGNMADAEDLVQTTFVAAIEAAPRFDAGRRLLPWLVAILTHAAQSEHRRRRRAPQNGAEPDRLPTAGGEPAATIAARELADLGLGALDRLPEPYRQPVLLRVVHDLTPAEIALLLGRSPGTVRAQIHRGLDRLRQRLPAGAVAAALAGGGLAQDTGRGLAAIRELVLAHGQHVTAAVSGAAAGAAAGTGATAAAPAVAAARTAAPQITALTGALVMSKKVYTAAAVLLAGAALFWIDAGFDDAPPVPTAGRGGGVAAIGAVDAAPPGPADHARSADAAERLPDPPPADDDASRTLHARVHDGVTGAPIAGAVLELFAPRELTVLALQREYADFGRPLHNGRMGSAVEWLSGGQWVSADVLLGAPGPFLVPPGDDQQPRRVVHTDEDGRAELPKGRAQAVLRLSHPGYGVRVVPLQVVPPVDPVTEVDREYSLWPVRRFTGVVRAVTGELPADPLKLLVTEAADSPATGAWVVETDAGGRFQVEVAGQRVAVACRTPGWTVVQRAKGRHLPRVFDADADATVWVRPFGSARLHVTDAATGEPIESLRLQSFDEHGFPRHCGRYWARDGWFELGGFDPESIVDAPREVAHTFPSRSDVVVWSDGYRARTVAGIRLYGDEPEVVEVALERGELDRLTGRVQRAGEPVAGALVGLRPYHRLNWQLSGDTVAAMTTTGDDGSFALSAVAGDYVCEVLLDDVVRTQQSVSVPGRDLALELGDAVQVTVLVLDDAERPVEGNAVVVTGSGGQQRQDRTDAAGRVTLGPFSPGLLRVAAPMETTDGAWTDWVSDRIEAAAGSQPSVTLRLRPARTYPARLVFDGPEPPTGFAGFTARDISGKAADAGEVVVAPDGLAPLSLAPGARLCVAAPDGRQWRWSLPADLRETPVLHVRWSGLAYEGDIADDAGARITGGRIFASPVDGGATVSAATDDAGAFRLDGLEPVRYLLSFHETRHGNMRDDPGNSLAMALFEPRDLPSATPPRLALRVPRFEDGRFVGRDHVEVTGRAVDAAGKPVPSAVVGLSTLLDQEGGTLRLFGNGGWGHSAADGSFRFTLPRGDRYRSTTSRGTGAGQRREEWRDPATDGRIVRDLVVD